MKKYNLKKILKNKENVLKFENNGISYVMKFYKKGQEERISRILKFQKDLSMAGFSCPMPIMEKGRFIFRYDGGPASIFTYEYGNKNYLSDSITIEKIGKFMGWYHSFTLNKSLGEKDVQSYDSNFFYKLLKNMKLENENIKIFKNLEEKLFKQTLSQQKSTQGIVHGDMKPGNILYTQGMPTSLVDFDNAHNGDLVTDLGDFFFWTFINSQTTNKKTIEILLKGYNKINQKYNISIENVMEKAKNKALSYSFWKFLEIKTKKRSNYQFNKSLYFLEKLEKLQ